MLVQGDLFPAWALVAAEVRLGSQTCPHAGIWMACTSEQYPDGQNGPH